MGFVRASVSFNPLRLLYWKNCPARRSFFFSPKNANPLLYPTHTHTRKNCLLLFFFLYSPMSIFFSLFCVNSFSRDEAAHRRLFKIKIRYKFVRRSGGKNLFDLEKTLKKIIEKKNVTIDEIILSTLRFLSLAIWMPLYFVCMCVWILYKD